VIGLTELNVWLDVFFFLLWGVVLVGLTVHFLGNVASGRAKKRFAGWEWPEHEGPPVPFTPKALHFQHVFVMILLAVSGMYIRFPFFEGGRTFMRWVHYIAMTIVIINLIIRLWYAFGSRQRDYREFAITKEDISAAPHVVGYYTFVKKSKPHLGKYNVMQKGTYMMFVPLLILQALTGLALLTFTLPLIGMSPRDLLVGWWLGALLGSTDLAGWWMRTIHYTINWLFIILTTVHAYLSVTEDFPAFLNFFGLAGLDKHNQAEHGDAHEPAPVMTSTDH
jgi:Ni,Fe-hydrogenase I cytochrome b subunit